MSSCSLGVRAFRPSVQAAAHLLSKPRPCMRLLNTLGPISHHSFSSWPSTQQSQQPPRRQRTICTVSVKSPVRTSRTTLPTQRPGVRTLILGPTIIKHYVDLPPNYTDAEGLPFAKNDLGTGEVVAIFGPHLSTTAANKLLRILHGRRVAGTLDDPAVRTNTLAFSKEHQRLALEYLRNRVPVDEVTNAGLRAEDELAALEREATADDGAEQAGSGSGSSNPSYASKFKLYQDAQPGEKQKKDSVYGPSALDAIRAHNKAKWEAELARREEERLKREAEERDGKAGPLQVHGGKHQTSRQLSPKMQEYIARGQSTLRAPPPMSASQRLWPSALFALAACGLCFLGAALYAPPRRADRLWPDVPPAAATVGALMLANLAGYALWKIPPAWGVLNRYFMVVAATPRAAALLGAVFSHQSALHLLQNMAVLWFLGVRLHDDIGRGPFVATYFASGVAGAFGSLAWAVLRGRLDMASLGASGAVYGIGAAYLWLHRFESFRILGLPPPPSEGVQGLTLLALATALDIGGFFTARRLTVDLTSHLVGVGVGILAAHLVERGRVPETRGKGRGAKQVQEAVVKS